MLENTKKKTVDRQGLRKLLTKENYDKWLIVSDCRKVFHSWNWLNTGTRKYSTQLFRKRFEFNNEQYKIVYWFKKMIKKNECTQFLSFSA